MALPEFIESIDILDYISQFADFEEKDGEYWAYSMFNSENTPSFSIRRETGQFYDFSAGFGGGILTWVRRYNNCSTQKAIEILQKYAESAGVGESSPSSARMQAVKVAKRFFPRMKLKKISKSVVLPDDYMERYEKNNEKLALWESEGISRKVLDWFNVCYDPFSDRLVYPIRNIDGKIINVSGRTTDERYKEKGLRKYTYFFQLGFLDTVYGLAENRESIVEKREIIVFEGAKSTMICQSWGISNTAALLTSHLNPCQLKILAKLACRVVFALDKGVTIRNDTNIKKLRRFVEVEYIFDKDGLLDDKMSPVDKGCEVWKTLYEGRLSYR